MGRVFKENSVLERFYEAWMNDSGTSDDLWSFIQSVPLKGNVLDCGCGSGTFTRLCSPHVSKILGIDLSLVMIEKAKSLPHDLHVNFEVMDMSQLKLNESYDRILAMNDVLNFCHSLKQLQDVVNGVYKHLKPCGVFSFDVHHPQRLDELGYSESGVLEGCDYEYMLEKEGNKFRHTFLWYEADYPTLEVIFQTIFDEQTLLSVFDDELWSLEVVGDNGVIGFEPCEKWMIHARRKA